MKRKAAYLLLLLTLAVGSSFQKLAAQENSNKDQEKEIKIKKDIERQKRAMIMQKKAENEALNDLKKSQDDLENLRDIDVQVEVSDTNDNADFFPRTFSKRNARAFHFESPEPFVITPGMGDFYGRTFGGESESTSWQFSRSVKENTFSRDYSFDVEKSANSVVMSVMGDCKAGEIRIKIIMPNGKSYSDIVIDEFGNLNWRKSFSISETENQDKAGEWKFQIASVKATGYFKISLQTY